ncbi:hypothetical protein RHMOL_Rhmol13G0136500 [Rhododendron molle]|uniref:Uncharacterized protein n=1 Tax=Rhododendron molle TaxID=49168 RepID=A0ACC0L7V2_RHOML|nr:hypothetical protein RHMOL_Rhmol13G0136500 [Rhododendron molle]
MSFFKRRVNISESDAPSQFNIDTSINDEQPPPTIQRVEFDDTSLVREPGLRFPIREHPAMKHVKTNLRNKMEDDFLANSMIRYIERDLVQDIDSDSIIDDFYSVKHRRVQL